MKRLFYILLSILLLAGCANEHMEAVGPFEHFWYQDQGGSDDPIIFPHEIDFDSFYRIEGLDGRFRACAVPKTLLDQKTTRALSLSILHYPMNYIILAYNYYDEPVRIVYDKSPLHRELAERKDAAAELVTVFEKTSIDLVSGLDYSMSYESILLCDELFLEYFLGSGIVKGLDSGSNKTRLAAAVTKKRDERLADTSLNSSALTLIPLAYMSERLGLGVRFSDDVVSTMHDFTLRGDLFKIILTNNDLTTFP